MPRTARSLPIRLALPVFALGLLSACADQTTAPTMRALAPSSPSADLVAAANRGTYLVMTRGQSFNGDFAARVEALGGTVRSMHQGSGLAVVDGLSSAAASKLAAASGIAEVDLDAQVALVKPAGSVRADASDVATRRVKNDVDPTAAARFSWQWNMRDISAPQAWAAGRLGSKRVRVAILDSGIDYDAIDLNGLVDLSRSVSFSLSDDSLTAKYFPTRNPIADYNGHGTNVASQVSSNAIVLAGVTAHTTLMGVKVLGADGRGYTADVLNGILYAADNGADVANLSLGGSFTRAGNGRLIRIINRVLDYARRKGMLVVVAAGNDGIDLDHNGDEVDAYCDMQHVICVSAVGPATATSPVDMPAFYTNYGRAVDVAAPGGNADAANGFPNSDWPWGSDYASWVWSFCSKDLIAGFAADGTPVTPCASGNYLNAYIGTSQATPHVSGLAALVVDRYGKNNPAFARLIIEASADDLGKRGRDPFYGHGRINVANALGLRPLAFR